MPHRQCGVSVGIHRAKTVSASSRRVPEQTKTLDLWRHVVSCVEYSIIARHVVGAVFIEVDHEAVLARYMLLSGGPNE